MTNISIVIPYYNDSVMVVKCIDSIHKAILKLPKSKQAVQIIVIDDHSPTPFVCPSSSLPLSCYRLDENKGVGTARNKGAELAQGDYLLFIDSDVVLDENHLCIVYEEIEQNKDLTILQGPTGVEPANESANYFQHYLAAGWNYYEEQNWEITVFTQCVLVKKDFFIKMGGFVEKFSRSGGEEFEFALRLGFIKGSYIKYNRNLIHYHHFDKIEKRLKKVYFRSRYISSIALGMTNLPLRFKAQAIMRSLYSQLLNLCLLVCIISPVKGIILYALAGTIFYFSDWSFSKHMIKTKSYFLSLISVFFRQAEYTFINLGMLASYILPAGRQLLKTRDQTPGVWPSADPPEANLSDADLSETKKHHNCFPHNLKFLISKTPVYMIFWVTQNCNFRCKHCFNYDWNSKKSNDLSLTEIEKITLNLDHIKYLTLAGGEPLLRDDLGDIAELFYKNNELHVLNLVTNGWYTKQAIDFARRVLKNCPKLHISIGVSVDGPEKIHDYIRSQPGSYQKAVETILALKNLIKTDDDAKNRLTIAACGTYNKKNADYLAELADFFQKKLGVPYFAGLIRGASVPDNDLMDIDIDHYMDLIKKINFCKNSELAANYPFIDLRIAVDQIVSDIIYKSYTKCRKTVSCKAGKKGFVLSADGEILLCEVLNIKLGNVRDNDYSPYKILKSPNSLNEIKKIRQNNCHCTWECFQRLNVVFSPEIYHKVISKTLNNYLT